MGPRYVSQEEYNTRQKNLIDTAEQLIVAARNQLSFIRSIHDTALRKQLIQNEKGVYAIIKQLCTMTLKTSRLCVRREASPQMKSGFAKPKKISAAMCEFAGWDAAELRSRNDVTRYICDYVKSRALNDANDRRRILPDDKLARLIGTASPVTYNHIQSVLGKLCFVE